MRLASVMSLLVVSTATPMYIMAHGFRAAAPLLISLVLGIVWAVTS